MGALLELPKNKVDLSDAIEVLLQPALEERNIKQCEWWITEAYMEGIRNFQVVDRRKGAVEVSWEDEDGELFLRWDEPMTRIHTEIGRLCRLNTAPRTEKKAHSLESLRNASIAKVLLDNINSGPKSDLLAMQYLTGLVLYGTYGIASWRNELSQNPLSQVGELIPPWELLSFPARTVNATDVRAIGRTRIFPKIQLLKQVGKTTLSKEEEADLEAFRLPHGAEVSMNVSGPGLVGGSLGSWDDLFDERPGKKGVSETRRQLLKPEKYTEEFVRLREIFTLHPDGDKIARYMARAGKWIARDVNYLDTGKDVPFPVGIARYQNTGKFYGASFASKIIPFALELEHLLERLIQNMADMDRFGFLMVPHTLGINFEDFKATETPRVVGYEPDLSMPNLGVDNIGPANTSDMPGRVLQFGVSLMDRIVAQGPMYSGAATGRAESGRAFEALAETGATHLLPTAMEIEACYATLYRNQLHNVAVSARQQGDSMGGGLELTKVENSIAGVAIDPQTGKMMLEALQVPGPWSVDLGIQSRDPLSKERERQESLLMLEAGALAPLDFIILNYKNGWGYPIGNQGVWENYVRAVLINLILFNDGEKPGELPFNSFFNPRFDKAEVHMLAIEDFVASSVFGLASEEVQNAFYVRMNQIAEESAVGGYPEGLQSPEQLAAMAQGGPQGPQGQPGAGPGGQPQMRAAQ